MKKDRTLYYAKWYQENKERKLETNRERARQWIKNNKERHKIYSEMYRDRMKPNRKRYVNRTERDKNDTQEKS